MPRFCRQCNRPLEEPYHNVSKKTLRLDQRPRTGKQRIYECKVKLVATSPTSGKMIEAERSTPRTKELKQRYIYEGNFKHG